jgi:hypothetical protein
MLPAQNEGSEEVKKIGREDDEEYFSISSLLNFCPFPGLQDWRKIAENQGSVNP